MQVEHDLPDLAELDVRLGRVVGARAPPHDVLLLLLREAPAERGRVAGEEGEDDERKGDGDDALDQEDPPPRTPAVGAVEVLGDGVRDQPVEGAGQGRHGRHDGTSRRVLGVLVPEGEIYRIR